MHIDPDLQICSKRQPRLEHGELALVRGDAPLEGRLVLHPSVDGDGVAREQERAPAPAGRGGMSVRPHSEEDSPTLILNHNRRRIPKCYRRYGKEMLNRYDYERWRKRLLAAGGQE